MAEIIVRDPETDDKVKRPESTQEKGERTRRPTSAEIDDEKTEKADRLSRNDSGLLAVAKLVDPTMTERKLATLIKAELKEK